MSYFSRGYRPSKPDPLQVFRHEHATENVRARSGASEYPSVLLCPTCGSLMQVKGANRRGTVWRRCANGHDEMEV